ncbi:MAG: hypothetical protein OEY85_12595 [Rhodospirillales bacterium]|nr:hypothetical protein [Rhodospirillales bacterium]
MAKPGPRPSELPPKKAGTASRKVRATGPGPAEAGVRRAERLLPDAKLLALLTRLELTQWWPMERLLGQQLIQAQKLIDHAQRTAPFYRERLAAVAGLKPGALTLDRFRQIPPLTREEIQGARADLFSQDLPPEHGLTFDITTSGSTGKPVTVKGTGVSGGYVEVLGWRYHLWHKRDMTAKNMNVRGLKKGKPLVSKGVWGIRGVVMGPACTYAATLRFDELFDGLIKEKPGYLLIQPNTFLELLKLSRQKGVRPEGIREVRTQSELVTPELRERCRKEWNVPVVDMYSTAELGTIALQCPEHDHYHIQSEAVLLEVIDDDGQPCPPGTLGRVVVTNLHNYASPLIRYQTGDYAELGPPCPCGRGLPVLARILGRERNFLHLPDGGKMAVIVNEGTICSIAPSIRRFQLIQKTLQEIHIRVEAPQSLSEEEESGLRDYFTGLFRHAFDYRFIYLDEIALGPMGKFEFFKTEVTAPH